jgi:hypothetical protein
MIKINSTIDDIDALVRCWYDEYLLISRVLEPFDQQQFQRIQILVHCSFNKDNNM